MVWRRVRQICGNKLTPVRILAKSASIKYAEQERVEDQDNTKRPVTLVPRGISDTSHKEILRNSLEKDMDTCSLLQKKSAWPRLLMLVHGIAEIYWRFPTRFEFSEDFLWSFLDKVAKSNVCYCLALSNIPDQSSHRFSCLPMDSFTDKLQRVIECCLHSYVLKLYCALLTLAELLAEYKRGQFKNAIYNPASQRIIELTGALDWDM